MKKHNPYDIEQVAKKWNITKEEAAIKVQQLKEKTSGTLNNFIKRHGEEEGKRRFELFKYRSKHTRAKYIEQFGEIEGEKIWQEYISKKDCNSLQYFITKYGSDIGLIKFKEKCDKSKITYELFVKKYGDDAKSEYQKYILKKTRHLFAFAKASKESLKFFKEIIKLLDLLNVTYFIGVENNNELSLWDDKTNKRYYYDLTIPTLHLIFEFDGISHPHCTDNIETWRCPYSGSSYNTVVNYDNYKTELAKQNGYDVYRFHWKDIKNNKLKEKERIIKIFESYYENSKNQ